jgi:SHS family lactate transporter-like MFS transporter
MAWIAAWLGWTLDAFDFTIFLLIMVPIAETFKVPLIEVTAVFTVTLWLRLVGAFPMARHRSIFNRRRSLTD